MPWEFDFCFSYTMLIVEHACWQPMTNYKNLFIVKKKKKKLPRKDMISLTNSYTNMQGISITLLVIV